MSTLYKELVKYSQSEYYPFHMPGGKRSPQWGETGLPYLMDISEIEGFDDLHHAVGLIKELEERASKCYGSEESALLVNGSTSGLLSGIMACTNKEDKVLVGRGSHKSIYHGVLLNELEAVYLYPDYDEEKELPLEINPEDVERALRENPDIKAVIVTSPTYDGVVSDIKEIARVVHKKGIPLIVDEAHGAHFGFSEAFPRNSNALGADLVIHSLHKTLPSLTQTALIHKNGDLVDWEKVRFYLQLFQSSSPSYMLMSSIDVCISMLEDEVLREKHFTDYQERLQKTRKRLKKLSYLKLIETKNYDISKILISGKSIKKTGLDLYRILLEKYKLQMEMATGSTVLAMTSIADREEGFERLAKALEEMDKEESLEKEKLGIEDQKIEKKDPSEEKGKEKSWQFPKLEQVYSVSQARERAEESSRVVLPFKECENHISLEFVYLYPPGIPLIVPGEKIDQKAVSILRQYERLGYNIKGVKNPGKIKVRPFSP